MKKGSINKKTRREFLINATEWGLAAGLSSMLIYSYAQEETTVPAGKKSGNKLRDMKPGFEPAYLKLHRTGELTKRADKLWSNMESCLLCPRKCGIDRLRGRTGVCRTPGTDLIISSVSPHFGEERPLVGRGGSGTIFFAHCNLRCVFCQNWETSHRGVGTKRSIDELAGMMLRLQEIGCHNINLVTPTHYAAHILKALDIAAERGLHLPIVYNTSGWELLEIVQVLDGIVDIYLPDFKYWDSALSAKHLSRAECYPEVTKAAILEMNRQVGVAKPAPNGIMQRGLMIRHLVMPNNVGGSENIMRWVAENLPKDTFINIMRQYTPQFRAFDYPEISRRITSAEYEMVVKTAQQLGLTNLEIQGSRWF